MNRAPWIDGLRFLAAAAVFVFHTLYGRPVVPRPEITQAVAKYGYLGVVAFFMISGYVITLSAVGRTRLDFARARVVRLWPAFLIAACLTEAARAYDGTALPSTAFLANLTMVPHLLRMPYLDPVYWSLMYEIVFYAYVTLLLGAGFVDRLRWVCAAWLALSLVNWFTLLPVAAQLLLDCAPYFTVGIAIYFTRHERRSVDWFLGLAALLLGVAYAVRSRTAMGTPPPNAIVVGAVIVLAAAALYWASAATARSSGWLIALGGISYPLYLVHNEIGAVLEHRLPLAAAVLCILALATAVWRIELMLRRRLHRGQTASSRVAGL